jgi:hypothetical protein
MEIYIAQEALKIIGPRVSFTVIGDSGKEVRRIRCANCGSPLVTEFDVAPGFICIKACSLDDASDLRPDFLVYVRSKQPWADIGGAAHRGLASVPQHRPCVQRSA